MWNERLKANNKKKPVRDVGRGARPRTLVLRERVLKIEISRTRVLDFMRNHKVGVFLFASLAVVAVFLRYTLIGFASTADFYPTSCLGSWDNVANALGKPDVPPGYGQSSWTSLNSAFFGTSTAQIFCGNFVGDTDINTLASKPFESADVVVSWTFVTPGTFIPPTSDGGGGGGGIVATPAQDQAASSTPTDIASSTASSTDVASSTNTDADITSTDTTSTDATSTDVLSPTVNSDASSTDDATSSTDTMDTTMIAATTTASASASTSTTDASTSDASSSADTSSPADTVPTSTDTTTAAAASSTSWLTKFFSVAYAQVASSTDINSSSSPSSTIAVPTVPQPSGAIQVNTSMFQNIVLPSSTADDILSIVYSTDGTTWLPVVNINRNNWEVARYALPIHSWTELQHLQIAFVGLGEPDPPGIYLDSVGVEVNYVDTPEQTIDVVPTSTVSATGDADSGDATGENVAQPSSSTWTPPVPQADILQQSGVSEGDVFEQGAHQQCVVSPFSRTISAGEAATLSLQLFSGLTTSTEKAVYQARMGSLPVGISATITNGPSTNVSSTDALHVSASEKALPGSYSILVIYRERQDDASMRSTGCQMNLVVQ